MRYFFILFLATVSCQAFAKDFDLTNFAPITPVAEKTVEVVQEKAQEVVQNNPLEDKIGELDVLVNDLMNRVKELELQVVELKKTTCKCDSKVVAPPVTKMIQPVKPQAKVYPKIITVYSIPGCAPCAQWKQDSQGIYKKAFEREGFKVVEGNNADLNGIPGVRFPHFNVRYNGKKGDYEGLITVDFIKRLFE